jgi:hypothetical protein
MHDSHVGAVYDRAFFCFRNARLLFLLRMANLPRIQPTQLEPDSPEHTTISRHTTVVTEQHGQRIPSASAARKKSRL